MGIVQFNAQDHDPAAIVTFVKSIVGQPCWAFELLYPNTLSLDIGTKSLHAVKKTHFYRGEWILVSHGANWTLQTPDDQTVDSSMTAERIKEVFARTDLSIIAAVDFDTETFVLRIHFVSGTVLTLTPNPDGIEAYPDINDWSLIGLNQSLLVGPGNLWAVKN